MFKNPEVEALRTMLGDLRRIAIVGASPKPERPSHYIAKYLIAQGIEVVPVHPVIPELFGLKVYPTLSAIPGKLDLANFFINAERVGPMVDEAIALGMPRIWLQDGVVDDAAAARAQAAGLEVVMDDCIYRRWKQLMA